MLLESIFSDTDWIARYFEDVPSGPILTPLMVIGAGIAVGEPDPSGQSSPPDPTPDRHPDPQGRGSDPTGGDGGRDHHCDPGSQGSSSCSLFLPPLGADLLSLEAHADLPFFLLSSHG